MPGEGAMTIRCGQSVPVDEVFRAWTSGDLPRMLGALGLKTHPVDRHFLLMGIVDQTYKRRSEPEMAETCLRIAKMHLAEFPQLAPILRKDFDGRLPRVLTFQHYATILSEQGQYAGAIQVCEAAIGYGLQDGTKSGYEGRIERIKKRAGTPVPAKTLPTAKRKGACEACNAPNRSLMQVDSGQWICRNCMRELRPKRDAIHTPAESDSLSVESQSSGRLAMQNTQEPERTFADEVLAAGRRRHNRAAVEIALGLGVLYTDVPVPDYMLCCRIAILEAAMPCLHTDNGGSRPSQIDCIAAGVMASHMACVMVGQLAKCDVEVDYSGLHLGAVSNLFTGYTMDEAAEMVYVCRLRHQELMAMCETMPDVSSIMESLGRMATVVAVDEKADVSAFEKFHTFVVKLLKLCPPLPIPPATN